MEYAKYKSLDRFDIEAVRDKAAEAAKNIGGSVPVFDPSRVTGADIDIIDSVREELRRKEIMYRDNFELYIICEMALLYLDTLEKSDDLK